MKVERNNTDRKWTLGVDSVCNGPRTVRRFARDIATRRRMHTDGRRFLSSQFGSRFVPRPGRGFGQEYIYRRPDQVLRNSSVNRIFQKSRTSITQSLMSTNISDIAKFFLSINITEKVRQIGTFLNQVRHQRQENLFAHYSAGVVQQNVAKSFHLNFRSRLADTPRGSPSSSQHIHHQAFLYSPLQEVVRQSLQAGPDRVVVHSHIAYQTTAGRKGYEPTIARVITSARSTIAIATVLIPATTTFSHSGPAKIAQRIATRAVTQGPQFGVSRFADQPPTPPATAFGGVLNMVRGSASGRTPATPGNFLTFVRTSGLIKSFATRQITEGVAARASRPPLYVVRWTKLSETRFQDWLTLRRHNIEEVTKSPAPFTFTVVRPATTAPASPEAFVFTQPQRPEVSETQTVVKQVETREIIETVRREVNQSLATTSRLQNFTRHDYEQIGEHVYSSLVRRLTVERERLGLG